MTRGTLALPLIFGQWVTAAQSAHTQTGSVRYSLKALVKKLHKRMLRDTLGSTQRANLVRHICTLLPDRNVSILDMGCGNGLFSRDLRAAKPNINIIGVETKVNPACVINQCAYNGSNLPFPDKIF